MIRKAVLGGLAMLIVIAAMIIADRNMTIPPTIEFTHGTDAAGDISTYQIDCHATGPGEIDKSQPIYYAHYDVDLYESMSDEDFRAFAEHHGFTLEDMNPQELEEFEAFRSAVRDNTVYYCGQLRENRQTGLVMIYGQSLLLLGLVGIAAVLTAPRPKTIETSLP